MNPTDVAERLRTLVRFSTLSPNALSELAGLDRSYLRLILGGHRTAFGAAPMTALAELFGVELDWLLRGRGTAPSAEAVSRAVQHARDNAQAPAVVRLHDASIAPQRGAA
ncbi:MAG: helix-turn-helix transcriptional regulator [Polyangiales bacterium]